jgi:tRNA G18 (ribose-2'-O)-methylase SpoU
MEQRKWNCVSWLQSAPFEVRREINMNQRAPATFSILCLNVTADSNIGNMIRTASLLGCKNFYTAGRRHWDRRSSVGAHNYMNMEHLPDVYSCEISTHHVLDCDCGSCKVVNIPALRAFIESHGYTPIFIEQGGMNVLDKTWHSGVDNVLFIYGNEHHGIPRHVMREIGGTIVSIPQLGIMRSHNVGTTCAIVLWEFTRQHIHNMTYI